MSEMTPQDKLTMTRATMSILDSWKLDTEQMSAVLSLPTAVRARGFQKFRSHESFPDDPKVERCADYILRIAGESPGPGDKPENDFGQALVHVAADCYPCP